MTEFPPRDNQPNEGEGDDEFSPIDPSTPEGLQMLEQLDLVAQGLDPAVPEYVRGGYATQEAADSAYADMMRTLAAYGATLSDDPEKEARFRIWRDTQDRF